MMLCRMRFLISTPAKRIFTTSFGYQYCKTLLDARYKISTFPVISQKIIRDGNCRSFYTSGISKAKMVTLVFLKSNGLKIEIEAEVGERVYEVFKKSPIFKEMFPAVGICEGSTICASCHVHLPEDLYAKLGEPSCDELDTLSKANNLDFNVSRLACCMTVTEELDGVVLLVPEYDRKKNMKKQD